MRRVVPRWDFLACSLAAIAHGLDSLKAMTRAQWDMSLVESGWCNGGMQAHLQNRARIPLASAGDESPRPVLDKHLF